MINTIKIIHLENNYNGFYIKFHHLAFDGYSTQHFPSDDGNSFQGYINRIYSYHTGELILCTSDGLYAYNIQTNLWRTISDTLAAVNVTSLTQRHNGDYMVTTFKGLFLFDRNFQLQSIQHLHSEYLY